MSKYIKDGVKDVKKLISAVLITAFLCSCANQEPLKKQTQSGKPEGNFPGKTAEQVSNTLTWFCNRNGFMVYESSKSVVFCGKQRTGSNAVITQALIGNSYSTPPVDKLRFSISEYDSATHVWADTWVETQMVGGQIQQMPVNDNNTKNSIQNILDNIKIK
ncbi:UNVERIFIED_ORG: hypothetical protein M2402_000866 [Rahnella aquatilis]